MTKTMTTMVMVMMMISIYINNRIHEFVELNIVA